MGGRLLYVYVYGYVYVFTYGRFRHFYVGPKCLETDRNAEHASHRSLWSTCQPVKYCCCCCCRLQLLVNPKGRNEPLGSCNEPRSNPHQPSQRSINTECTCLRTCVRTYVVLVYTIPWHTKHLPGKIYYYSGSMVLVPLSCGYEDFQRSSYPVMYTALVAAPCK